MGRFLAAFCAFGLPSGPEAQRNGQGAPVGPAAKRAQVGKRRREIKTTGGEKTNSGNKFSHAFPTGQPHHAPQADICCSPLARKSSAAERWAQHGQTRNSHSLSLAADGQPVAVVRRAATWDNQINSSNWRSSGRPKKCPDWPMGEPRCV